MMVTARADGVVSELKVRRGADGQAGRRHRDPVRRGARSARHAGAGDADAAQDRARGAHEAGQAGHAAEARGREPRDAVQGRRSRACGGRSRASAASSARRGRESSTTCRSRWDRRCCRSRARTSRKSFRSIRSSRWSRSRSAICTAFTSAMRPRSASLPGTRRERQDPLHLQDRRARAPAPTGSTSKFPMPTASFRTASPPKSRSRSPRCRPCSVPRSALTFSSGGELGVRVVDAADKVAFVPVSVVDDQQQFMLVSGVADGARDRAGPGLRARGPEVEPVDAQAPKTAER